MPKSRFDRPKANRVFTNRDKPIADFNAARASLSADSPRVLVFCGVGGQGKTALRKEFARILTAEQPRRAVWGELDLEVFNTAPEGLLQLRKTLRESGPLRFTAFDVALATYWEKARPTEDVSKALKDLLADSEGILGSVADNAPALLGLAEILPAGLGLGVKALLYARRKLKDSSAKRQVEALQGIEQHDAKTLQDMLPYFLGVDLREQAPQRQTVLFLDTYENLWKDTPDKTGDAAPEIDRWVRDLIEASPGVLFVILGRDELTWERRSPGKGWGECLQQYRLGGLSEADADRFLKQIPIPEAEIRAAMIDAAQGEAVAAGQANGIEIRNPLPAGEGRVRAKRSDLTTNLPPISEPSALTPTPLPQAEGLNAAALRGAHPFYLDLSVDSYFDLLAEYKTPTPADFAIAGPDKDRHSQIVARFLRHRSPAEQASLKLLAAPRAFDRALFTALIQHFHTGYPAQHWNQFCGFSFVETGADGRQRLHGLMREHLRTALDAETFAQLQAFLFNWYDACCQPASPKDVNAEHEWALHEAVYHRDQTDAAATLDWFWQRWRVFDDAARYAAIEPLLYWAVQFAEIRLGSEHTKTATALNNLAQLLQATNRLAEAEPLMRRALAIDEQSLGLKHPNVARDLNNLALLLKDTDRPVEAEPLLRRALGIDECSFGPEHPNVAIDLNNLAALLYATSRLAEAEPLMRRALSIDEQSLGPKHLNVARDLNNLAQLLQDTDRLAEAEPLMRRALGIDEDSLGPKHPTVARDLNNLAQLLQATNRLAEAEQLLRRALRRFP